VSTGSKAKLLVSFESISDITSDQRCAGLHRDDQLVRLIGRHLVQGRQVEPRALVAIGLVRSAALEPWPMISSGLLARDRRPQPPLPHRPRRVLFRVVHRPTLFVLSTDSQLPPSKSHGRTDTKGREGQEGAPHRPSRPFRARASDVRRFEGGAGQPPRRFRSRIEAFTTRNSSPSIRIVPGW